MVRLDPLVLVLGEAKVVMLTPGEKLIMLSLWYLRADLTVTLTPLNILLVWPKKD